MIAQEILQDYRSSLDPIRWHEGMPLTPQHFQLNDHRLQSVLKTYSLSAGPFHWGVLEFSIDKTALSNGIFRVKNLTGLLQDGSLISYQENSTLPSLEIDLTKLNEGNPIYIYIAVPKFSPNEPSASGHYPRYIARPGEMVLDENGSVAEPAIIPRLALNIYLVAGHLPSEKFDSLPLVEIIQQDGRYSLSDYTPPCFYLEKQSWISRQMTSLLSEINNSIQYAFERFNPFEELPHDQNFQKINSILIESALIFEPVVATCSDNHPFNTYQSCVQLAARLSSLAAKHRMGKPNFQPYDHLDIVQSFISVFEYIQSIIDDLFKHIQIKPFRKKGAYFGFQLPAVWKSKTLLLGIKWRNPVDPNQSRDWIKNAIITTEEYIRQAIEKRVLGAERLIVEKDTIEDGEFISKDHLLVEVQLNENFRLGDVLYVFNPTDYEPNRPSDIFFYVRGEDI
jgi:type VI secretion system protein ImpJ